LGELLKGKTSVRSVRERGKGVVKEKEKGTGEEGADLGRKIPKGDVLGPISPEEERCRCA